MSEAEQAFALPGEKKPSWKEELFDWIESIVISVLGVVLVFTFILRTAEVDGTSMVPTLHDHDRLIISHLFYEPDYLDVIVINSVGLDKPIVKRVIGLPGDKIDIDPETGTVYVNDKPLTEPYIAEAINTAHMGDRSYPVIVDEGTVFVMGDNRNNSLDSRFTTVGMIDEKNIIGKVVLRIFPFGDFGTIE